MFEIYLMKTNHPNPKGLSLNDIPGKGGRVELQKVTWSDKGRDPILGRDDVTSKCTAKYINAF